VQESAEKAQTGKHANRRVQANNRVKGTGNYFSILI
jgi:hypothetical protein